MRSFFWKFVLCLAPCVLAGWVTVVALGKYFAGESGGFKLGVDLVGGTILVYEIDLRKHEGDKKGEGGFDPKKDINVLAEALKKRIDPNDLYNIVIRPAGGEGRVEIILPTGGTYRSEKADKDWKDLVDAVAKQFDIKDIEKLKVPRGRVFELADAVQLIKSQNLWGEKLLNSQEAWDRMTLFTKPNRNDLALEKYKKDFAQLQKDDPKAAEAIEKEAKANEEYNRPIIERNNQDPKSAQFFFGNDLEKALIETDTGEKKPAPEVIRALWQPGKAVDVNELVRVLDKAMANTDTPTNEAAIKNWIKAHAWNQLLHQALEKWTWLKGFEEPTEDGKKGRYLIQRIPPDNNEQLTGFIQSGGTFIGQATLYALDNIIGANPLENYEPAADAKDNHIEPYKPVKEFIESRYGFSHRSIVKDIQARAKEQGRGRDLTVEEVQRIKEQVARVGLLEFRILANEKDDRAAIDAVIGQIDRTPATELKERADKGLPPPGPMDENTKEPKIFEISVAHGEKSFVTYSWAELSRQQRRDLDLDNAARDDSSRRTNHWKQAETKVNKVFTLVDQDQAIFKGAVFFKRQCSDRNISPEERDTKTWEYFILTRDPEFEQKDGKLLRDAEGRPIRTPRIDGGYLTTAQVQTHGDRPSVGFGFNDAGANLFGAITSKNVPDESGGSDKNQMIRHLAIILDGEVMSAPTIQSTIRDRGQISGNFTQKELEALVNTLRAGRLPATLKPEPVSESTMGPTLGQDTIQAGVFSILVAFGAVLAFMLVYYRFAGLVASIALLANLLLTIGFMTAVQATFTLPGLAGLVLMLGMAVDANILIYERLREERDRGATLALAIRNGYDRALPTIIDTHLSSIFTAIVLYIVGNDQLKGFGVSLTVGLMISLFTSLYMTRLMFDFWLSKGWLHKLSMFRFLTKPNIDFMAIRKPMFIITLTLSILGFALFFGRAPFNIDFVGGTAFGSQLTEPVTIGDLRGLVSEKHQAKTLDVKEVKEAAVTIKETTPEADVKTDKKGEKAKKRTSEFGSGRYTIVYADGEKREVQLLNPPEKATKEEREQAVKVKASGLADTTVEQQFPSFAKAEPGKSAYFVVRTSEKEPELVQAALDRLLRDKKGATLLRRTYIEATPKLADRTIKIEFFDKNPDDFKGPEGRVELEKKHRADGSPLFIKSLFSKELMIELGLTDKRDLPAFEVRGEGTATPDGQYHTLVIKLEKKPDEDAAKIETALQKTQDSFNGYIQPDRLENFDSQLATETRYRALWAILASWLAIMVYLWFRFGSWTFGLAAVICLIHDLFITLGFIAVAHYLHGTFIGDILGLEDFKVDLPAVAALLTLVGYSVNDTIVVFDRIREVRGKNPDLTAKMINDSVNQTLSRTILSSTTTWLVVFVLYVAGGPGVHLFSYIMVVGVIVGTYSSIYIASPLLLLFGEGHKETGPRTARPAPEPSMA